jgi:hypothetical protein
MARRRIGDERVRKLLEAYEQWNPGDLGMSKATMYRILREHGIGGGSRTIHVQPFDRDHAIPVSEKEAVGILLEALIEAKMRVKLLEEIMNRYRIPVPPAGAQVNVAELPETLGELLKDGDGKSSNAKNSPYLRGAGPNLAMS